MTKELMQLHREMIQSQAVHACYLGMRIWHAWVSWFEMIERGVYGEQEEVK